MDSINKNQPEENYQDLNGEAAIEKMKTLIEKSSTCFFCTAIRINPSFTKTQDGPPITHGLPVRH